MISFDQLWIFNLGAASANYVIVADGERQAMEVARAWCSKRGKRPPAVVRPFITADASILETAKPAAEVTEAPEPSLLDKAKALVGAK